MKNRPVRRWLRSGIAAMVAGTVLWGVSANAAPTVGDPNNPAGLQGAILAAYRGGAHNVTIAPGTYALPAGQDSACLTLRGLKDFEIVADGVTLSMQAPKEGVGFYQCQNVTFRGATLHYWKPLFSQGKILRIAEDNAGLYYDVQVDAGYPYDADFKASCIVDAATRHFKPGNGDISAKSVSTLSGAGLVRIHWNGKPAPPLANVVAGDYVVCRGGGGMMIHDDGCTNCTFRDLTIYWGGVFAILDSGASGNHFLHINLTYGPTPPGGTNAPLISQSADGFHSPDAAVGPDVEDCTFEGMCDDGIAVHGTYELVDHSEGTGLILGSLRGRTQFRIGDPIRVYDNRTGQMDSGKVVAVSPAQFTPTQQSKIDAFEKGGLHYSRVTVDHPMNFTFDSVAADPALCGAGYKLIHNTIRNNRARGLLLKADDGLVQDNTIDGSTIAGIVVAPEVWWPEADYSHHVRIVGNTVRTTGYAHTGPWNGQAAAITITGDGCIGNQDVTIENNTVEDTYGTNLIVRYTNRAVIRNNQFRNTHRFLSQNGRNQGIDPEAVIWIGNSRNVTLEGNGVTNIGPYGKRAIAVAATASGVKGADTGVRLAAR